MIWKFHGDANYNGLFGTKRSAITGRWAAEQMKPYCRQERYLALIGATVQTGIGGGRGEFTCAMSAVRCLRLQRAGRVV